MRSSPSNPRPTRFFSVIFELFIVYEASFTRVGFVCLLRHPQCASENVRPSAETADFAGVVAVRKSKVNHAIGERASNFGRVLFQLVDSHRESKALLIVERH